MKVSSQRQNLSSLMPQPCVATWQIMCPLRDFWLAMRGVKTFSSCRCQQISAAHSSASVVKISTLDKEKDRKWGLFSCNCFWHSSNYRTTCSAQMWLVLSEDDFVCGWTLPLLIMKICFLERWGWPFLHTSNLFSAWSRGKKKNYFR